METRNFNPERIIARLKFFNYSYDLKGTILKIYLPMFCYLKINFANESVKMSAHISFGFQGLSLEYNFLIYELGLFILAWFWVPIPKYAILIFLGTFLILLVVCFIKIESLRTTVHNWMEKDAEH